MGCGTAPLATHLPENGPVCAADFVRYSLIDWTRWWVVEQIGRSLAERLDLGATTWNQRSDLI